jgi:hypothetical protein
MALVELLQKSGESDFLRAVAEAVLQILMEADVEGLIGAGRHERTGDRLNLPRPTQGNPGLMRRSTSASQACGSIPLSLDRPGLNAPRLPKSRKGRQTSFGRRSRRV